MIISFFLSENFANERNDGDGSVVGVGKFNLKTPGIDFAVAEKRLCVCVCD